jgi:hypothetical protein
MTGPLSAPRCVFYPSRSEQRCQAMVVDLGRKSSMSSGLGGGSYALRKTIKIPPSYQTCDKSS